MNNFIKALEKCILFKNIHPDIITAEFNNIEYFKKEYTKNDVIAIEHDECYSIGIILSGTIEIQKIYPSGKTITIQSLSKGNIFGEVIVFSNHDTYPSTVVASTDTSILFLPKNSVSILCSTNKTFLNNFMSLLSNKILMLNNKIKSMSYKTIRQKICNYLLEEYSIQKNNILTLSCNRNGLADKLGVQRPSLSREFIKMKEDNLIDYYKNTIKIIKLSDIEEILENG